MERIARFSRFGQDAAEPLAALKAGVGLRGAQMLITASGTGLTVTMITMAMLWLTATIHHSLLAKTGPCSRPPRGNRPTPAAACWRTLTNRPARPARAQAIQSGR